MNYHPSMAAAETTVRAGKLLVDLKCNECKYAVGEDDDGRYLFCSAKTEDGISYCPAHCAIEFQYAPESRRRSLEDVDARLLLSRQAMAHIYQRGPLPSVPRATISKRFVFVVEPPKKPEPIVPVVVTYRHGYVPEPEVPSGPSSDDFRRAFEAAHQKHPLPAPFRCEAVVVRSTESKIALIEDPAPERPCRPSVKHIQLAVCELLNVSFDDLISSRRTSNVVDARQIAMYLCRHLTLHSFPEIGRRFSRDHTTILHAVEKIEKLIKTDEDLRSVIETLKDACRVDSSSGGKTKTHGGAW